MHIKLAIANIADNRPDYYLRRKDLVEEEIKALNWLRRKYDVIESDILLSNEDIYDFAQKVKTFDAQSLVIHIPIWATPVSAVKLQNYLSLPILLLGNSRPETSSIVGILGAGGALDQIACSHARIFDHTSEESQRSIIAFIRAAAAKEALRGQTLGLFGGRSLGIFTAEADPAQWERLFGVEVLYIDQNEIIETANALEPETVKRHMEWLKKSVCEIEYNATFTPGAFERQVRSYIATRRLVSDYKLDFIGVKCQPELSDGYVTQCVSHMLMNGVLDADGKKNATVHVCESDADGALTMQILNLLSEGQPTALLDLRWFNREKGTWTLANCGALPASFFSLEGDKSGLSKVRITGHAFGKGGGGALPAVVAPQTVTLARLCRKAGRYRMYILSGNAEEYGNEELSRTTGVFPQAIVKIRNGNEFVDEYGSNHIHMVSGDYTRELVNFCRLTGIEFKCHC